MPPILSENHSVTQEDSDELPQIAHEKLFHLKNLARSRSNFAVLLLRKFFQPSELEGRNIAGARGKGQVNPVKVNEIKKIVNSF